MMPISKRIDLDQLKVHPLPERRSLSTLQEIALDPESAPKGILSPLVERTIAAACHAIKRAERRGASIMLIYGAHLLRNGAAPLVEQMLTRKWLTHLATNGAGTIHDWEFAHLARSTESVADGVATGTFGTWDETGANINLAVQLGGTRDEGYGAALGRWIAEDGGELPTQDALKLSLSSEPAHPCAAARADLLQTMLRHGLQGGRMRIEHPWKSASIVYQAWRHQVPLTVHPGIGYDIITNHPYFNGGAIGRGAEVDFRLFGGALDAMDGGVVLSIGSAIMGPQVFEKSLSCVNNLRLQSGRKTVSDFDLFVVDLQDGGNWDWSTGEPPKTNPAYYLRFCKSYSRMGGRMSYSQCHNLLFLHALYRALRVS
jgi:hypothetical protein